MRGTWSGGSSATSAKLTVPILIRRIAETPINVGGYLLTHVVDDLVINVVATTAVQLFAS